MPAIINEQSATMLALIDEAGRRSQSTADLHASRLCVQTPGCHLINHQVDAVESKKPLLVRDEMSLVWQGVYLVTDECAAMAGNLHRVFPFGFPPVTAAGCR